MSRSGPWFGAFLLVLVGAFFATFGRAILADPVFLVLCAGLAMAGVLSIASGFGDVSIGSVTLSQQFLLGASHVTIAAVVAVLGIRTAVTTGTGSSRLVAVGLVVGSAVLAWLGTQTARDGRYVDHDRSPSRRQLVGVVVLAVASLGVGALLASIV
ncbi:hypothetical protein RBH26_11760 [Natronolimnohabitans sp. A-GB9]|uniref:hypothetical protein n=1 Tax=Natronolimnohabitans sp. A-GB9 TaxID=3069757 RepID=UPI0027B6B67C|nr:hypothetical protein [Natronolimnohabitans sp. A-GB9]MDQ2051157.1 hypothetical protein [Natronolimnohabitans sp. A-GB9]